jgi:hypothetical protein
MMSNNWPRPSLWIWKSSDSAIRRSCAGNSVIQSGRISRCVFGSKRLRRREKSKRAVRDQSCQIMKRIPKSILRLPIEKRLK